MLNREYPREEMELRWNRARAQMEADGLDAILVTERGNFWWFSGARGSTQFYNKMRPNVAVVPRVGDPFLIVYSLEQKRTAALSWVPNVLTYVDAPFPPEVAVKALKEFGLAEARIGLEFGESQRMWFSRNHLDAISAGLPGAQLVDGSPTIENLRLHKTPFEITLLKDSINTAQRALDRAVPQIRLGMTARDLAQLLTVLMIEEGADLRSPGDVGGDFKNLPPDHVFESREVVKVDFGAVRKGYWSDICRRVTFKPGNEEALRDQELIWHLLTSCAEALGPGVPVSRIHEIHNREVEKAGHPPVPKGKRIGHGLGIDPSEPPSISGDAPTILEPGMVVTLEPRFPTSYGGAHIEEDFVITENGCEWLSGGQSKEILIVG
jgi:Xaa-Pro aminopeptidase